MLAGLAGQTVKFSKTRTAPLPRDGHRRRQGGFLRFLQLPLLCARTGDYHRSSVSGQVTMLLTLECIPDDLQCVKVCIAAAVAGVSLKVQHVHSRQSSGPGTVLELLPLGLTQPNAIAVHLGKQHLSKFRAMHHNCSLACIHIVLCST